MSVGAVGRPGQALEGAAVQETMLQGNLVPRNIQRTSLQKVMEDNHIQRTARLGQCLLGASFCAAS